MGVPFLPVRGILGSAYLAVSTRFRIMADPFSGENLVGVQALTPDVTLVHDARGDARGNLLIPGVSDWGLVVTASRKVFATVEERVAGPLQDQPEWRLIPGIWLTALVHCPSGAAPTGYRATTPRPRRSWPTTWKAPGKRQPSHATLKIMFSPLRFSNRQLKSAQAICQSSTRRDA